MKEKYEEAVMAYVNAFAEKHEFDFDGWVGDYVGEIACFGDFFVNFDDIRIDIDTNQHVSMFSKWYYSEAFNINRINYRTFIKMQ